MSWQGVHGCEGIALQFARANRRRRLGGSFLFVGPEGSGKRTFAFTLGKTLLCRRNFPRGGGAIPGVDPFTDLPDAEELARFTACGTCDSCKTFDYDVLRPEAVVPTHPDFHYICKPADKSLLPLSLLVGDREDRSQAGLCFKLNQTSFMGGRKVAVIDDADYFNLEGANALLKTLEEPPRDTLIILIGTSAAKQLPTIRSRCQIFRFSPMTPSMVSDILFRQGKASSQEEADAIARRSGGSMVEAYRAFDSDFSSFQNTLFTALSRRPFQAVELSTKTTEYVDGVSKEAVVRRPRLQNVLKASLAFFRALYSELETGGASDDPLTLAASPFARKLKGQGALDTEQAIRAEERTLDALGQVDQNANLPYVTEAWLYDLAEIMR